ncbi:MAG: kynureninase, partial [Rhizobiales bacterium]|nr:kynureninase [Hyphomicrobiales bacterium]
MTTREDCLARDRADPLAGKRSAFALPEGIVYLDGNSLGTLPRNVAARVAETIDRQWGETLIKSWNEHGWFDLPRRIGDRIAKLIGAPPASVVACDTISVNLYKLLGAAIRLRPRRRVILSDTGNFPTD